MHCGVHISGLSLFFRAVANARCGPLAREVNRFCFLEAVPALVCCQVIHTLVVLVETKPQVFLAAHAVGLGRLDELPLHLELVLAYHLHGRDV